jgi:hypothetical protein
MMEIKMNIRDKFALSGGITILVCVSYDSKSDVIGKKLSLVLGEEVRQTLTISGERKMLNQQSNLDQWAFETKDTVSLSQEEAQSGEWQLISA